MRQKYDVAAGDIHIAVSSLIYGEVLQRHPLLTCRRCEKIAKGKPPTTSFFKAIWRLFPGLQVHGIRSWPVGVTSSPLLRLASCRLSPMCNRGRDKRSSLFDR